MSRFTNFEGSKDSLAPRSRAQAWRRRVGVVTLAAAAVTGGTLYVQHENAPLKPACEVAVEDTTWDLANQLAERKGDNVDMVMHQIERTNPNQDLSSIALGQTIGLPEDLCAQMP